MLRYARNDGERGNDEGKGEWVRKILEEHEEVIILKKYVKIILYTYPFLKTVEKDYEEHIAIRALLSYENGKTAEQTAEYLAKEIIEMHRLEWLKGKVECALQKLSDEEKLLVEIKYFGNKRKLKALLKKEIPSKREWTERSYFRRQKRLEERLDTLFKAIGITEDKYRKELADLDVVVKVAKAVERQERRKNQPSVS